MKYCAKCGHELMDEAILCTNCGCMVEAKPVTKPSTPAPTAPTLAPASQTPAPAPALTKTDAPWISLGLGLISILHLIFTVLIPQAVSSAWWYDHDLYLICQVFYNVGFNICPLLGTYVSIKCLIKGEKNTFTILGLILSAISFLAIIGDTLMV